MVGDDFRSLKIQVLECVKELRKDNGEGPAACRFHTKLLKLVDCIEINNNEVSSCDEISSLEKKLHDAKCAIVDTKRKIAESQDKIDSANELINRNNLLYSQLNDIIKVRDHKVRNDQRRIALSFSSRIYLNYHFLLTQQLGCSNEE